jgi:3-oxoacyl-[acyl-carrier protein] reductase
VQKTRRRIDDAGGTFEDFDMETWEKATRLMLLSAVSLIHAALPYLKQSTRAAILTMTSASVKQPVENLTLSNTIRLAVIGLTKTLSLEYGSQGIRVNSILPGLTDTERITADAGASRKTTHHPMKTAKAASAIPLGRMGSPEEFANAAVFLCSPAAGFITGVALPVDGGTIRATL